MWLLTTRCCGRQLVRLHSDSRIYLLHWECAHGSASQLGRRLKEHMLVMPDADLDQTGQRA